MIELPRLLINTSHDLIVPARNLINDPPLQVAFWPRKGSGSRSFGCSRRGWEEQFINDHLEQLQRHICEALAILARLNPAAAAAAVATLPAAPPLLLSKRMRQFLKLLCHPKGYHYKEIAAIMGCHLSTLRTYRERIAERYGITGKSALINWAFANGLA